MRGAPHHHGAMHAGGMILTEYGLHFAKEGDRWRSVGLTDVVMLPSNRYRVGGCEFATLTEALQALVAE